MRIIVAYSRVGVFRSRTGVGDSQSAWPSPSGVGSGGSFCEAAWRAAMRKHSTAKELGGMHRWKASGPKPAATHDRLKKTRQRLRKAGPDLTTVRRALGGSTHKRSRAETRGGKRILSDQNLEALDRVR